MQKLWSIGGTETEKVSQNKPIDYHPMNNVSFHDLNQSLKGLEISKPDALLPTIF